LQAKSHLSQTLRSPEEKEMSLLIEEMTIPSPPPTKPGAEGVFFSRRHGFGTLLSC